MREGTLHAGEDVVAGGVFLAMMSLEEIHRQRGHQSSREEVRRQHGEHHRFSQGYEQELGHAGQEKHRNEDNADAQCGNQRGNGDLIGSIENGAYRILSLGEIPLDVLDGHGRVVNENADS